jgi:hypothetical protein
MRNGKLVQRGAMWVLATGVAGIAAVVSYSHIYDLGRLHGGSGAPGRLLPFFVDMLIVVGELMLLHEADEQGNRFWLGWVLCPRASWRLWPPTWPTAPGTASRER